MGFVAKFFEMPGLYERRAEPLPQCLSYPEQLGRSVGPSRVCRDPGEGLHAKGHAEQVLGNSLGAWEPAEGQEGLGKYPLGHRDAT
jgi:hypothetical protein